ncbi:transglycosylase associated protein [Salmonella enterica]|uniref:Transglycosylase associated protein n=1 Tax=Salmonella enterica TaxID=28901 RepID=A0A7D8IL67_SALER|nr:transglycosylase associated protein [Salmonella enterica]
MGIIAWIVFGLIAGVIAKLLMPGRDGGGFILTCILGIVGAVVGRMAGDDVWYWRQYQRL